MVAKHAREISKKPVGDDTRAMVGEKLSDQSSSVKASAPVAELAPRLIHPEQLVVDEGEDPQWVDAFGVIHPGLIPPKALEDVVEDEGYLAGLNRKVNFGLLLGKKRLRKKVLRGYK